MLGFAILMGILDFPLVRPDGETATDLPAHPVQSVNFTVNDKIDEILGASGGRFRIFNRQNRVIRIDTSTSRIAILDTKKEAWLNLQVGEGTATGFENERLLEFLQNIAF